MLKKCALALIVGGLWAFSAQAQTEAYPPSVYGGANAPSANTPSYVSSPVTYTTPSHSDDANETSAPLSSSGRTFNLGNFYGSLGAGVIFPTSIKATYTGNNFGAQTKINLVRNSAVTAFMGYKLTKWLAAEAEFIYSSFDTSAPTTPLSGFSSFGSFETYTGLANIVFSPGDFYKVHPYFGGGIGVTVLNSTIFSLAPFSSFSNKGAHLALDALMGVDYTLVGGLSLGLRYQYLWANTSDTIVGSNNISMTQDDFAAHLVTARLGYQF